MLTSIQRWLQILLLVIPQGIISVLLITSLNLGDTKKAQIIFGSIPESFAPSRETILSNAWTLKHNFSLVLEMFNSKTLLTYLAFFLIGPACITWILFRQKFRESLNLLIYVFMMFSILLLFGWDWGRWISLLSFTLIGISTIFTKKLVIQRNYCVLANALKVTSSILIICFSLLFSFPSNGPRDDFHLSKTFIFELIDIRKF
jgi:hypothetical protein